MDIILCHTTAYRFWRAFEGDAASLAKAPRAFAMTEPYVPMPDLDDELASLGIFPAANCRLHLLFSDEVPMRRMPETRPHVWRGELPGDGLLRVAPHVLVGSPALTFVQMAEVFGEAELAMAACELAGCYAIDSQTGRVARRTPLVDCAGLRAFAAEVAGEDSAAARAAARAFDRSPSPMQAKLALLLTLPPEMGGFGLPRPVPDAAALGGVALFWPAANLLLAYDGREMPGSAATGEDAVTRMRAPHEGEPEVDVLRVGFEQVENPDTFAVVAATIARWLGVPLPERGDGFAARHGALRDDLGL